MYVVEYDELMYYEMQFYLSETDIFEIKSILTMIV